MTASRLSPTASQDPEQRLRPASPPLKGDADADALPTPATRTTASRVPRRLTGARSEAATS